MTDVYDLTEQALADAFAEIKRQRDAIIEECPRVAEMIAPIGYPEIASAIRALKDKPC